MNIADDYFAGASRILDVGGWFKPEFRATHVVDMMPWETRGVQLTLEPLPGERFSKATWFQADFLEADFRLPFPDKYFDMVVCGHTVGDLADPRALLREMQRVGMKGLIECPSRITEQTMGIRDRESSRPGHPHHHWIVDSVDGTLFLYSKPDSALDRAGTLLPLLFTERCINTKQHQDIVLHPWRNEIFYSIVRGPRCAKLAEELVDSLKVRRSTRVLDHLLRFARSIRTRLKAGSTEDPSWWAKVVELSRPYSRIELK